VSVKKYDRGSKEIRAEISDESTAISGGSTGAVPFQSAPSTTNFIAPTSANQVLSSTSSTGVSWGAVPSLNLIPSYISFIAFSTSSPRTALSTDGVTWSEVVNPFTGFPDDFGSVYAQGQFVVVTNSAIAYRSTDGITWVTSSLPASRQWKGLAYGRNTYVAIARGSNSAATSTNGITWTARTLSAGTFYSSITYGNNVFVAAPGVNASSAASYSTDGVTWTASTLPSSITWSRIAFGAGVFAIASESGATAYSTNGITWTAGSTTSNTTSLVYGHAGFVGAGGSNQAIRSTDGITWTSNSVGGVFSTSPIMYGGGRYIILENFSSTGRYTFSTNGTTWTVGTSSLLSATWRSSVTTPLLTTPRRITGEFITSDLPTLTIFDNDKWVNLNTTQNHVITLPSPGISGRELVIKQNANFTVSSASANVLPLTSTTPGTAILSGAGKYARLVSDGFFWVIMEAN